MKLRFDQTEYRSDLDGSIQIELATIRTKLSPTMRRLADDAERLAIKWEQLQLDRGLVERWLTLHADRSGGKLGAARIMQLLDDLIYLYAQYGQAQLETALLRIIGYQDPHKCTLPYLQSVLANQAAMIPAPRTPAPPKRSGDAWEQILAVLAQRINRPSYNSWIRPCKLQRLTTEGLIIKVPSATHQYWLDAHYADCFARAFCEVLGIAPKTVQFLIDKAIPGETGTV